MVCVYAGRQARLECCACFAALHCMLRPVPQICIASPSA